MQNNRSMNNFSFRRASSGGSISSTQSEYFNRRTGKNDFERVYMQWSAMCDSDGYMIPKNAIAEFKKRISQAGKFGEKAKLNLSYCSLDDKRLVGLIECLAQKPIIAKLDLRGNDFTDEGVKVLVKLLKGQLRLVKEIEKDKRLTVSFLAEVSLEQNSKELDQKLVRKIYHMCDALRYVNAHAFIRSKYLESHAPEVILSPFLIKMWFDVVGKLDHERISKAFANANISERSTLGYEELEKILTQGLMLRGALPSLTEETFKSIRADKMSKMKNLLEDDDQVLMRELNSIPLHVKSQEDYEQELLRRSEMPLSETMTGKDDSSSVNDTVANTVSNQIPQADSNDSILTNEEIQPYLDPSSHGELASTNVPFLSTIPESLPLQDMLSSSYSLPVPHFNTEVENVEEPEKGMNVEELNEDLESTPAAEVENLKSPASDYTIPRIDTVSCMTSVDANDNKGQAIEVKLRSGSQDSKHRLSDLFDEIDEVFVDTNENSIPKIGSNEKVEKAGTTKSEDKKEAEVARRNPNEPKPPVHTTSTFIQLPRKGSNLYEDTVLDLPNRNLQFVRFSEFLSPNRFRMLKVLILRNNKISTLTSLQLFQLLPNVTDLDLAHNDIQHRITDIDLPRRIQRLDLSHNQLTDVTGLMSCVDLKELNLSHNQIKALYGLPVKLQRVDISHNRIHTVASLRSVSMCVTMTSIAVKGNPVMQQLLNVKVFMRSVLPSLQEIDGVKLASAANDKKKSLEASSKKFSPSSPKPTSEEQKLQDSIRSNQVLAKQKVMAAAVQTPVSDSYMTSTNSDSQRAKRLKQTEIDILTKRLYAPRGSPNDPRKYATKVPSAKKHRRHSGDGKQAVDSASVIDEWLGNASQQFDRIVKAFRTAKSYIRFERLQEKELDAFNALLEEIQAHQLVDINILLKPCLDQKFKDHDKIAEIPKMHHDLEKSVLILHQIQTILLFCCDGAINFVDGMDLIMGSKAGQYVNENVLKLYNFYYEVNYNYQDFVTRQASTRSISNEGFNYDVRDEFMADNPMVDVESRRRSSMITILSQSADSNPMNRVRNRVMNKYLPPEIKLDLSLDNQELQFAESNPMKGNKKSALSPLRTTVMTDAIVKQVMHQVQTSNDPSSSESKEAAEKVVEVIPKDTAEEVKETVTSPLPQKQSNNQPIEETESDSPAPSAPSEKSSPKPTNNTEKSSPSLLTKTNSFKRSIDKIAKKISTKNVDGLPQPEEKESQTAPLSAKERLKKRMSANKSKIDVVSSESQIEIPTTVAVSEVDDHNKVSVSNVEETVVTQNGTISVTSASTTPTQQSKKSPLKVQTDVIAVTSAKSSPRAPTTSPRSPVTSPRLSSSTSPKSPGGSSKSPKVFTFVTSSNSPNAKSDTSPNNANAATDTAKINAKERLRLRMEKNKKNNS